MVRVHIICEGQTEETFVKHLLQPDFSNRDIHLTPALIGKPGHKGGNVKFDRLFTDVRNRLLGDTSAYCTTFFDFYGLPTDFPGKLDAATKHNIYDKAQCVQEAVKTEVEKHLGANIVRRFIPYIQMYEFEGLLFSDCQKFASAISKPNLATNFQTIRSGFHSPEDINDSPNTAPSKRVIGLMPEYEKPFYGVLAAREIGLSAMRQECRLFDAWLQRLEMLTP